MRTAGYTCTGSPDEVADTLTEYQAPVARADNDQKRILALQQQHRDRRPRRQPSPCSIRLESLSGGYSHGTFIFLGPGFIPGSPAGGAGGSPGGPGGVK